MIGQLVGTLLEKQPPTLVINVGGVGYEVDAPMSTFYRLPDINQAFTLYTHLVVREDAHHLYGFYTRNERLLFRALLKVNGVGPRLALTVLSRMEPEEFVRSILNQETEKLVCLPGVGKKTADRLIIEMRDKLKDLSSAFNLSLSETQSSFQGSRNQIVQDALSALISLGYKPQEASRAIAKIDDHQLSREEIIKQALREVTL